MDAKQLKQKILYYAIRGKLVPQDPSEEPASVLVERILHEKELIYNKKHKKSKPITFSAPLYEDVPYEIPASWEWVQLKDIAYFGGGKTPSMACKAYWQNGTHLWVTSKDMKSERINDSLMKISDEALSIMTQYQPGTILLVTRSGILRHSLPLAVLEKDATVNQDLKTISLYIPESCYYIYYAIKANEAFILKEYHKDGTTVDSINFNEFSNVLLPLPPLAEQLRIVNYVNNLFELIDRIEDDSQDIRDFIPQIRTKILSLAINGKLVSQDSSDEPAYELLKRIAPNIVTCDDSYNGNLPEGWSVCHLEDIIDYKQPTQYIVESTDYDDSYETPVLTAGKSFILGYTNETDGIFNNLPAIIFDDFTTDSRLIDFPFKVKSSAMKILKVKDEINIKYVAYFMSITRLIGDTHKRYWISEYSKIPIPIPPAAEQKRIVEKLDDIISQLDKLSN